MRLFRFMALVIVGMGGGCFSDSNAKGATGTDTEAGCEPGFAGCPCLPDNTCAVGLVCIDETICEDEGGTTSGSGSTTDTTGLSEHRVFITSATFSGNLGGLEGADAECQSLADFQSLTGTWRAVLRDGGDVLMDRISIDGPVYNLGGELVAEDAANFFSGSAEHTVAFDESMNPPAQPLAWVGAANDHCTGWTQSLEGFGRHGDSEAANGWLNSGTSSCAALRSLYCIDQTPP